MLPASGDGPVSASASLLGHAGMQIHTAASPLGHTKMQMYTPVGTRWDTDVCTTETSFWVASGGHQSCIA